MFKRLLTLGAYAASITLFVTACNDTSNGVIGHHDHDGHNHETEQAAFSTVDPFGNNVKVWVDPKPIHDNVNQPYDFNPLRDLEPGDLDFYTFRKEDKAQAVRTCSVLIAADEEYRAAHANWQTRTRDAVELADNHFWADHEINFIVYGYANWSSQGANGSALLSDLASDFSGSTAYDFVIGFTADNNFEWGGIAYVYGGAPSVAFQVNGNFSVANLEHIVQHESSHNYGLGHDAQGSGIVCVMNYDFTYSTNEWDQAHDNQIQANKNWYGF